MDRNRAIKIMGILNVTPDSFYAPSRNNMSILQSGADIIDIGGESSRPGFQRVSAQEEWRRLEPTLKSISPSIQLSIDTTKSCIVRQAYEILGRDFIVNDISSGEDDKDMLQTVSELKLPYVSLYRGSASSTLDVLNFFRTFARQAEHFGLNWIIDPGFGFGKNVEENWNLLRNMEILRELERPILVGISRKRMIYEPLGLTPETCSEANQAAHLEALEHGADILRVHDVPETIATIARYRLQGQK